MDTQVRTGLKQNVFFFPSSVINVNIDFILLRLANSADNLNAALC